MTKREKEIIKSKVYKAAFHADVAEMKAAELARICPDDNFYQARADYTKHTKHAMESLARELGIFVEDDLDEALAHAEYNFNLWLKKQQPATA